MVGTTVTSLELPRTRSGGAGRSARSRTDAFPKSPSRHPSIRLARPCLRERKEPGSARVRGWRSSRSRKERACIVRSWLVGSVGREVGERRALDARERGLRRELHVSRGGILLLRDLLSHLHGGRLLLRHLHGGRLDDNVIDLLLRRRLLLRGEF